MDRTIESLLKEAQARIQALLDDYELAMVKFREGYELLSKHVGNAKPIEPAPPALSEREAEIYALIGQGLKPREIAEKLGISVKTFTNHRDNIRSKVGAENVYHLAQMAKKHFQSQKP